MKTFTQIVSFVALAALTAGLLPGCSKSGEYNKSVDVKAMVQQLKSADKDQRQNAIIALGEAGPYAAEAVPGLIEALKDPEALNRSLSAYALGRIGPKAASAVPALKACLDAADPEVTPSVINALRAIDPKAAAGLKIENVSQ